LFATHRRGLRSVASKGLKLHKNGAILRFFFTWNSGCGEGKGATRKLYARHGIRETTVLPEKSANP
jgi:hypothetical protein